MVEEIGPENVVHVVTDNGSNYKKACKELLSEVYDHIAWLIIDTVQPIYKFLRFADQDKKPNMCEVVMAYQTMKQELKSFFGTNVIRTRRRCPKYVPIFHGTR